MTKLQIQSVAELAHLVHAAGLHHVDDKRTTASSEFLVPSS
jgi:hypothetical protein